MPRDRRVTDAVRQLAPYFGAITDAAFIDQTWDFNSRFARSRETLAGASTENRNDVLRASGNLTRGITYTAGTPTADRIANLINGSTSIHSFMSSVGGGLGDYDDQIRLYAPGIREPSTFPESFWFSQLTKQDFSVVSPSPSTSDPNFYAAVVSNPFMGPMVKDTGAVEIFMNGIPTLELSKCVPYINLELISIRRTLGTVAAPLTLLGFLNPPGLGAADQAIVGASDVAKVSSEGLDLGAGIRSGIELFTAPQTLVNMGQTGPEFVPTIDRLRPLASLGNLSLSTKLQGGTLSFTTGRLEIVIHDRSRLREMAAFVRPDLYGTTFLDITHGWSHPDGGLNSNNVFGQFLDALKYKTRYRISNSSFTFEEGGQIKVTLSIQTVGSIDLLYLGPRTSGSSLQILRQAIEFINDRLIELKARGDNPSLTQYDFLGSVNNPDSLFNVAQSKEFIKSLKELVKSPQADSLIVDKIIETFGKTVSSSAKSDGSIKQAQDEIKRSYEEIVATLPVFGVDAFAGPLLEGDGAARFKLLGTNVVVAQNGNGTVIGDVSTRTFQQQVERPAAAQTPAPAPANGGSASATNRSNAANNAGASRTAANAAASEQRSSPTTNSTTSATTNSATSATAKQQTATTGSAPPATRTVSVGQNYTVFDDGKSTQADDFYTFGSVFMKMVAEPIKLSGQYDEVQVIFYPFNRFAGAVHDLPISCFPIEKGRFSAVIKESATKVPELSGRAIIQVLNNRFISFAPSRAYLMSSFYNTKSVEEGKQDLIDIKKHKIKPSDGSKALELLPNYTLTLEARMRRAGIPEGKLQLPRVEVAVEGCPLLDSDGSPVTGENGQAKTLIKIHVYDATVDPHRTLSEIITAAKDNELGMIQVPTADYNKIVKKTTAEENASVTDNSRNQASQTALDAIAAGINNGILEGVSKETLERIASSNEQVSSIIEGIKEGTAFVRVKGTYDEIKRIVSAGMPTIIYGASTTAITNASITTGGSAGLPTVMIQRAFNSPGETAAENIESGVPMQILPAQLSLSTIGCPLFSPMQRFFIDFGTGTSLDSCYYVVSVDSTIGNDGYKTDLKMAYSAGFPTYQSLNMQLAQLAANFSAGSQTPPSKNVVIQPDEEKPTPKPDVKTFEDQVQQRVISAAVAVNRVKRDAEIRAKRILDKEKKRLEMIAAQTAERAKRRAEAAIPESVRIGLKKAESEKAKAALKTQEIQFEVSKVEATMNQLSSVEQQLDNIDPALAATLANKAATIVAS